MSTVASSTAPRAIVLLASALALLALGFAVQGPWGERELVDAVGVESFVEAPHLASTSAPPLTAEEIGQLFVHAHDGSWRPLTSLGLRLDAALFGPKRDTAILFVHLGLHVAAALLLLLSLVRATGSVAAAVLVAGVFVVHPLATGPLISAEGRGAVLGTFFWMLALWIHVRRIRTVDHGRHDALHEIALLSSMVLGVLSDPLVALLPAVLVLVDLWPLGAIEDRRTFVRSVAEKTPLFALGVLTVLIVHTAGHVPGVRDPRAGFDFVDRTAVVTEAVGTRVVDLLRPSAALPLRAAPADPPSRLTTGLGLGILALVSWVVLRLRRRAPWLVVGSGWFLLTAIGAQLLLDPGARLRPMAPESLVLVGPTLLLSGALSSLPRTRPTRTAAALLGAVLLVALTSVTALQRSATADTDAILHSTLERDPDNWMAQEAEAWRRLLEGDESAAAEHARHALRVAPAFVHAQLDLASAKRRSGDLRAAELLEANARRSGWTDPDADARLALVLVLIEEDATALGLLREALVRAPESGDLHAALALALARGGERGAARIHRERALASAPITVEGRILLVWLLATAPEDELRDPELALEVIERTLAAVPEAAEWARLLEAEAAALAATSRWSAAFDRARRAADLAQTHGWTRAARAAHDRALLYLQGRTWYESREFPRQEGPA